MRVVVAITAASFLYMSMAAIATDIPEPKIHPGYAPEEARDEQGIWMELEDYERAIQRSALLVDDPYINAYVRDVMCRVAGDYCADLRIYVIRNPYFNASMTANGVVQVWTGLLVRMSSEDELAAVLGHELAHYTQLHTLERLRKIKRDMATGSIFDLGLLLLTGVNVPAGQLTAMASYMSFSRENESEADLLGARFMVDADYDPNAAAEVWEKIVAEEARAVAKRSKPGLFSQTHPSSSSRIVDLDNFVNTNYPGRQRDPAGQDRHIAMLNEYYMMLMEDQLDTNRFGRTEVMLERHQKIGVREELVHFFHGEMYRQRNEGSDLKFAKEAYSRATQGEKPVADAYLNLGYMFLKEGNLPQAQYNFRKYLELEPYADDRAMIEFYFEEK
jgi:predicted Zn-dependent protease